MSSFRSFKTVFATSSPTGDRFAGIMASSRTPDDLSATRPATHPADSAQDAP